MISERIERTGSIDVNRIRAIPKSPERDYLLALALLALHWQDTYSLRARCVLVPKARTSEIVVGEFGEAIELHVSRAELMAHAHRMCGLVTWTGGEIHVTAKTKAKRVGVKVAKDKAKKAK